MIDYRVAVLGAGSVGLCLATNFASAGASVSLLTKTSTSLDLLGKDLCTTGLLGAHRSPAGEVDLVDASAPPETVFGADMLILTTKAYDLEAALKPFAARQLCPPVLLLQNGMGAPDIARDILGPSVPVFATAMMIGMDRRLPNHVEITAQASPILCGGWFDDEDAGPLHRLLGVADNGFVPMSHDPNIQNTIAFKLLFNACMNPTGAMTGKTYGELLEDASSRAIITSLADETLAAFDAAFNYRPARSGQHYVEEVLSPIIFPKSAGHRSSMLQDLNAGRRTEIDFLNGAVVRLAQKVGLEATYHEDIISRIKAIETQSA